MPLRDYTSFRFLQALFSGVLGWLAGMGSIITSLIALFVAFEIRGLRIAFGLVSAAGFILVAYRMFKYLDGEIQDLRQRLEPEVAITFDDQSPYVVLRAINNKTFRILRIRVKNVGGNDLFGLKTGIEMQDGHYSFIGDLTLKEEGLPIIASSVQHIRSTPMTSFGLDRDGKQFVNLATQEIDKDGTPGCVDLSLARIDRDNYGNGISMREKHELKIVVTGGGYNVKGCEKRFELFFDAKGLMQLREIYTNEGLMVDLNTNS